MRQSGKPKSKDKNGLSNIPPSFYYTPRGVELVQVLSTIPELFKIAGMEYFTQGFDMEKELALTFSQILRSGHEIGIPAGIPHRFEMKIM